MSLEKTAGYFAALVRGTLPCPECGDEGPHEDNGACGDALTFACRKCHMVFEPQPLDLDEP